MREIKFRAWNERLKTWDYFNLNNISTYLQTLQLHLLNGDEFYLYIGLTDNKNKDIYEGDIVRFPAGDIDCEGKYARAYIESDGGCGYSLFGIKPREFAGSEYSLSDLQCVDYKVIGNIHETPQLLEEDM
jgi:uncharacterized phage protein (TIGR01671 family)